MAKINEIRITSNIAHEITVLSEIEVSERLFQRLKTTQKEEFKRVQQHVPLICAFNTIIFPDGNTKVSTLVIRVPEGHNTIEEISTLAVAVKAIHEMILESLSQDNYLDNINQDLKNFYNE